MTATTEILDIPWAAPARKRSWPYGWWRLLDVRIGIVPLPIYLILAGLIAAFLALDKLPNEICMMMDKRATETRLRGWRERTRTPKCRRKLSL